MEHRLDSILKDGLNDLMIVISNLLTFDAKHLTPLILTFLNWILLWELMLGHRLWTQAWSDYWVLSLKTIVRSAGICM